jgi:RNA polymerase sigma-70 factor (ECF subfamily)
MSAVDETVATPMDAAREAQYLRLLEDHDAAIRRMAVGYEREPARRQDLVQDIWLALWQALPSFRGDCSERTFVFRIAHNRAVSHIQHWRRRATDPLPDEAPIADGGLDPERAASQRQRQERLQAAVRRLPLGLRQAVVLMLEGLSHAEIGDVLGITANNVAVRLTRARAALAELMDPSGAADEIRAYVRRRGRLLEVWVAFDVVIGAAFLAFLLHRAVTHPDPLEKLAMGLLASITAGTMAFGWWNWRGALRASSENTRVFVELSTDRSRRFARSIKAAWVVLAAQAAVFTPWVAHRLYGIGRPPTRGEEIFGWGLLIVMLSGATVFVLAVQAWARRDAAAFERIRRELNDEP